MNNKFTRLLLTKLTKDIFNMLLLKPALLQMCIERSTTANLFNFFCYAQNNQL